MSYADTILDQISELREAHVDLIAAGHIQKAECLQRAITELYSSYLAFTGDVD